MKERYTPAPLSPAQPLAHLRCLPGLPANVIIDKLSLLSLYSDYHKCLETAGDEDDFAPVAYPYPSSPAQSLVS